MRQDILLNNTNAARRKKMGWNFSFAGKDWFVVENGRLMCDWDKAANDFEAPGVPDLDGLSDLEKEEKLSDLYDCGTIARVTFVVFEKELQQVKLHVGKRRTTFTVLNMEPDMDCPYHEVLVEDFRKLYKTVPSNLRKVEEMSL